MKKDIRSLTLKDLNSFFVSNNYPTYRANQVYDWLWNKSCFSFDQMTNISLDLRNLLKSKFVINNVKIDNIQKSKDGTIKNAVKLFDNFAAISLYLEKLGMQLSHLDPTHILVVNSSIFIPTNLDDLYIIKK